jgi:lipid II:glycine glycyltransferase (peptidoglycan interpeptide bridge formation enzyme)
MSNLIFKKIINPKNLQNFVLDNNGVFTQADFYSMWHIELGKNVFYYAIFDEQEPVMFMQAIEINAPFGKKILYAPYGPIYKKEYFEKVLPILKTNLQKELKNNNIIFCRFDFFPTLNVEQENLVQKFFYKSHIKTYKGSLFQPRDEWVIKLLDDEEKLFSNIDKKNRYCIRQAEKSDIEVEIITKDFNKYFDEFYNLITETSKRNNFGLHKKEYYKQVFKYLDETSNGYIVRSIHKNEICDSLLFLNFGKTTMFIFGGSSDKNRTIPTAHISQWHSILYSKSIGMNFYNFGGITTDQNPIPSLDSVTRFKKRFGGEIQRHSKFYDLVGNKFWYFLFVLKKVLK